MRVIAGEFKGLPLVAPAGDVARPTTDRVKESMFNLMGPLWSGGVAVDLFAGSGALGIEAVSRGASYAVFVDTHPRSIAAIRDNLQKCEAARRAGQRLADTEKATMGMIRREDWETAWAAIAALGQDVGWVFLDPPYDRNVWNDVLVLIDRSGVPILHGVVCEHPKTRVLPEQVGRLHRTKSRAYGDIAVTLYVDSYLVPHHPEE